MVRQYWLLIRYNENFRRLWLAQVISEIGDWFYALSIYTLLLELTGQAASVGMALVLQMLPQTFAGPAVGVINDRLPRKQVMIFADISRIFIVLAMLLVRSRETVWIGYVALGMETVMAALFEPARSAVLPNIVREDQVLAANTLSSTTWSVNLAVGAALGGAAQLAWGRDAVFSINAVSFLVSALLIAGMRFREEHAEVGGAFRPSELVDFRPILEGARYIANDAKLLWMVALKGFMGLMGASWVLYPVMAERMFAGQLRMKDEHRAIAAATAILIASRGLGAFVGPLVSSPWIAEQQWRMRRVVTVGFAIAAIGYLIFAGANALSLACIGVVIAHAGTSCVWVNSTTLLQLHTEDRFRGRVFAADLGFCMLTISATSYIAGQLIDAGTSPRLIALGTGVLMIVPAIAWAAAQRLWNAKIG